MVTVSCVHLQWASNTTRDASYNYGNRVGANVIVFVLDTGVDGTHPEFGGNAHTRVAAGADCQSGTCYTGAAGIHGDCNGHGTHCAGIAAGR